MELARTLHLFIRHLLGQHRGDSLSFCLIAPCAHFQTAGPEKALGKGGPHQSNSAGFRSKSPHTLLLEPMDAS